VLPRRPSDWRETPEYPPQITGCTHENRADRCEHGATTRRRTTRKEGWLKYPSCLLPASRSSSPHLSRFQGDGQVGGPCPVAQFSAQPTSTSHSPMARSGVPRPPRPRILKALPSESPCKRETPLTATFAAYFSNRYDFKMIIRPHKIPMGPRRSEPPTMAGVATTALAPIIRRACRAAFSTGVLSVFSDIRLLHLGIVETGQ
jgi:hypothetical protein